MPLLPESELPKAWGQCAACAHADSVPHPREGEPYCRCGLAESDESFDKYPRVPVAECPGFKPRDTPRSE